MFWVAAMYWLIITTLYGTFAGSIVGSIISANQLYGREGDQTASRVVTLVGGAVGLAVGLVLDVVSLRRGWLIGDSELAKGIGALGLLVILWLFVLPALQTAY
jgi:hypothetical protein